MQLKLKLWIVTGISVFTQRKGNCKYYCVLEESNNVWTKWKILQHNTVLTQKSSTILTHLWLQLSHVAYAES